MLLPFEYGQNVSKKKKRSAYIPLSLLEQMELRKKLEREFQSLKGNLTSKPLCWKICIENPFYIEEKHTFDKADPIMKCIPVGLKENIRFCGGVSL